MKISFYQQSATENEIQHTQKSSATAGSGKGGGTQEARFGQSARYAQGNRDWMGMPAGRGEKGKSLIELQQEAANTDAAVQQDYMTVVSNTMSEEDYAKMCEEGFDLGSMEPEEAVNIVDKIKAELVRSGKQVAGYTDDIDMETLAAALGSQPLAQAVVDSFHEMDIPMTEENLNAVSKAWNMAAELQPMSEGSYAYLIDNEMEAEIWNLYLAQNSGAGNVAGNAPRFYAEDVQGYYTRSADPMQDAELTEQIDKVLGQSGREANDENRQRAAWLLEKGLPLTGENLERLEELENISLPVTEEAFAKSAATAIADGKDPVHGVLGEGKESLYEKAARLAEQYQSDEAWDMTAGNLTARRQLEEIRLRMTAEVNVKLLKSGFSIDTAPMEKLVEGALRAAEQEVAERYFPKDAEAVSKYQTYHTTRTTVAEIPGLPAQILGTFSEGQATATLETFHQEGVALQENYKKANESYEALGTAPRTDMGDSIRKAFANVDDILSDLGQELTEENRRAVRILGYNRMELTPENIARVCEADRQVKSVVEKLTPASILKMIRDGINPLEKSFAELETYFDSLPKEYREEAESYSRFLYGLERNGEVTEAERESYIGIYRLVRQIEKTDGAAVGALVNTQAELHFANLLSAVRSGKFKSLDVKASDELGTVLELVRKGESIPEQIAKAFTEQANAILTEVSYSEAATCEYNQMQLEQLRNAVTEAGSSTAALLERGELPASAGNLLAAEMLEQDVENLFAAPGRSRAGRGRAMMAEAPKQRTAAEEVIKSAGTDGSAVAAKESEQGITLWEKLEEKQEFAAEYHELTETAKADTEEISLAESNNSIDVRGMQLVHKQLTVMSAIEKQEEYFIPMYVGDVLTRVHLTFDANGTEKGSVRVGVRFSEENQVEAQLSMEGGELRGTFSGRSKEEVMKLERIADIFREEASENWTVGSIDIVPAGTRMTGTAAGSTDGERVENAELYRVAKVFLHAVQQGVKTDEN